jgi:hypothetical protein
LPCLRSTENSPNLAKNDAVEQREINFDTPTKNGATKRTMHLEMPRFPARSFQLAILHVYEAICLPMMTISMTQIM